MSIIRLTLTVVPEPVYTRKAVLKIKPPETVFFLADGDTSFLCGHCRSILADNIHQGVLKEMILKCNICESYNEVPTKKRTKPLAQNRLWL